MARNDATARPGAARRRRPGARGPIRPGPVRRAAGDAAPAGPPAATATSATAAVRVNCFTPGTLIATPRGEVPVETLKPGDRVVTRDNGPQEIRWIGTKRLAGPSLRLDNRLHPVVIRAGALGPGVPARDLSLSPGHRVLLLGDHPVLDLAEAEVLVSARHLVGTRGIGQAEVDAVSYIHFLCDRHEVVLSNGAWTESFLPSANALEGLDERALEEIREIFPELAGTTLGTTPPGGTPARPFAIADRIRKLRA